MRKNEPHFKEKKKTSRKPAYILHKEAEEATKTEYLNQWRATLKLLNEERVPPLPFSRTENAHGATLGKGSGEAQEEAKRERTRENVEKRDGEGIQVDSENVKNLLVNPSVWQALRLFPLWTLLRCVDTLECM